MPQCFVRLKQLHLSKQATDKVNCKELWYFPNLKIEVYQQKIKINRDDSEKLPGFLTNLLDPRFSIFYPDNNWLKYHP